MAGSTQAAPKRSRKRVVLSNEERALWQAVTRDVVPLRETAPTAEPDDATIAPALPVADLPAPSPQPTKVKPPKVKPAASPPPGLQPLSGDKVPGLDKASAGKLKRGKLPIEARLDLHGMTQEEAHRALDRFVVASAERGCRCVLVITGKGARPGMTGASAAEDSGTARPGVLRAAVPRWLNEARLRPLILAFSGAQQRDGGAGALYILLRRRR